MSNNWYSGNSYFASWPTTIETTSESENFIGIDGDTIRFTRPRAIENSKEEGFPGEMCIGVVKEQAYIFICTAPNSWQRLAFASW